MLKRLCLISMALLVTSAAFGAYDDEVASFRIQSTYNKKGAISFDNGNAPGINALTQSIKTQEKAKQAFEKKLIQEICLDKPGSITWDNNGLTIKCPETISPMVTNDRFLTAHCAGFCALYDDNFKKYTDGTCTCRKSGNARNLGNTQQSKPSEKNDTASHPSSITGTVVDENGEPLIGASVTYAPGKGAATDNNGKFTLNNIPDNITTITISFIGFTPQTLDVNSVPSTIRLQEATTTMSEVEIEASGCTQTKLDQLHANSGEWKNGFCIPTECISPRYILNGNTCEDQVGRVCTPADNYAKSGKYEMDGDKLVCKITTCKSPRYKLNETQNTCDDTNKQPCLPTQNNSTQGVLENGQCIPTECKTPEYKLDNNKCVCNEPRYILNGSTCEDQVGKDCKPKDTKATTGKYEMDEDKLVCKIQDCNSPNLEPDVKTNKCVKKKCTKPDEKLENGTCVSQTGKDCTNEIEHATTATLQLVNNKLKCIVTTCDEPGWVKNKDENADKCIESNGPCTEEQLKKIPHASAGNLRGGECVIADCEKGWHVAKKGNKCEQAALSEEDSKTKVDELRDNALKMKQKEQSTENKLLGAAAMGATGIGGMNLMSGMAEQSADDDAEQSMRAYLATFACDYGTGRNTRGGERDIVLPGGNDMVGIVNEYRALAADLKVRKEALGKAPGIESEIIYDIAETGLYDNVGMGRQSGAYTSLSRALTDETSDDAKKWADQTSSAASKVKTGAITAGAGAIGGLVGNLAINSKNKNRVDEINNKYKKKEGSIEQPESE